MTSHGRAATADGTVHTQVRDLPRLTSLRAFAAFAVAGYHLSQGAIYHFGWFSQGYAGVAFFFVLSGFVLTWSAGPDDTVQRFYRRRLARLYPSYLTAAVLAIVLGEATGARVLVPNLLMVQAWSTESAVIFGVNGVSWSLSCELFFYACFPLLLLLLRRTCRLRIVVGVGSAYVVICAGVGVVLAAQGIEWGLIAYANPLARSGEFRARHGPCDSGAARLPPADTRVGRRRGGPDLGGGEPPARRPLPDTGPGPAAFVRRADRGCC